MAEYLAPYEHATSGAAAVRDLGAQQVLTFGPNANLGGVIIVNNQAAAAFIQVFDASGGVTLGSTNPDYEFQVAANGHLEWSAPAGGIRFANRITVASTTTEKGATPSAAGVQTMWIFKS